MRPQAVQQLRTMALVRARLAGLRCSVAVLWRERRCECGAGAARALTPHSHQADFEKLSTEGGGRAYLNELDRACEARGITGLGVDAPVVRCARAAPSPERRRGPSGSSDTRARQVADSGIVGEVLGPRAAVDGRFLGEEELGLRAWFCFF